VNYKEFILKTF